MFKLMCAGVREYAEGSLVRGVRASLGHWRLSYALWARVPVRGLYEMYKPSIGMKWVGAKVNGSRMLCSLLRVSEVG